MTAWYLSLLLVAIGFLVVCVAISYMKSNNAESSAAAFAGIWTMLLLIAVSVSTTIIMRRFPTSIAIGFLLGIFFILSNQMLIVFAIFIYHAKSEAIDKDIKQGDNAFAAFSFMLFIVYMVFGTMLAVFRKDVIQEAKLNEEEEESSSTEKGKNDNTTTH
eukprot:CAMPEP_0182417428 /NCGR_PEP_ID=MMETSP1167-20130531/1913_1 /TAXON_ID=2988 /ORGANISM="Mallomonas Sp, Strain CCMP3275" /LENGTH=159 /DNA_ID=CAMNT_0024591007 /DNA_START=177 /DNA_END=656 /DNA_ORIENTATION=-